MVWYLIDVWYLIRGMVCYGEFMNSSVPNVYTYVKTDVVTFHLCVCQGVNVDAIRGCVEDVFRHTPKPI